MTPGDLLLERDRPHRIARLIARVLVAGVALYVLLGVLVVLTFPAPPPELGERLTRALEAFLARPDVQIAIGSASLRAQAGSQPSPAAAPPPRDPEAFTKVSIVNLIAAPERFHGRRVRAIGFCSLRFEGTALYLHRQDDEVGIAKNGVWIDVGWPPSPEYMKVEGKYAIIEGVFNAHQRGHFGAYAGSIVNVTRLEEWRMRTEDVKPPPKPR